MTRLLWIVGTLVLAFTAAAAATPTAKRGFVRVEGTRFVVDGKPFYFVGANLNVMHGPTARKAAAATIAAAAADGLTVGRLWALGEGTADEPAWKGRDYLFRIGPEGWQEQAFQQLDHVIAEAGKRGLRLIITLSNHWKDYGGIPMYLRWAGDFEAGAYGYDDRFFTNDKVRQWFLEHLRRVVGRVNSITKVAYRDDPTIMAWEMQNEMNGTPEMAPARRRWFEAMAKEVRRLDPNHLVVPGLIGYNLQVERKNWIAMCKLPAVSFCDQHIYPQEHLRSRGWRNLRRYIDDRVQLAHYVVGKPIVFGEYGFADKGAASERARLHGRFLRRLFHNGGNGALIWIYQPTLSWKRRYGVLIDKRRYRPLRRSLRRVAHHVGRRTPQNRNHRIGVQVGERPVAPTHVTMVRHRRPFSRWRLTGQKTEVRRLEIPADRFYRAHFEEAGSWDGGVLVHTYGRRTGWFEYRFRSPRRPLAELRIRLRLSSEYPAAVAPKHGRSRVKVLLDGQKISELVVMPDDGVGAWYEVVLTGDSLRRVRNRRLHVLRLQVDDGALGNGVAVYGRETAINREPVDDPGPLELIATLR